MGPLSCTSGRAGELVGWQVELLADLCAFEHFIWISQICETDLLSNKSVNVGKVYGKCMQLAQQ